MATYHLTVNGQRKEVKVDPSTPLLWVLREELKMTGTKYGCGISVCGACTVHLDGVATRSCVVPISLLGNRRIVTIEGIGSDPVAVLCRKPGWKKMSCNAVIVRVDRIMSAAALLKANPEADRCQHRESMGGNLCRCVCICSYSQAIKDASKRLA